MSMTNNTLGECAMNWKLIIDSVLYIEKDMDAHFLHARGISSVKNWAGFVWFSFFSQIQLR